MKKSTGDLLKELSKDNDLKYFINSNADSFTSSTLSQYLNELLCEKNINKTKAIEKSNLNNIYAYEIFSGKKKPSRNKLIQLAFGMELDLKSVQRLLKTAGLSELYVRYKRDSIIAFAFNNSLSLFECEELLETMGEEPIQQSS
ncbi:MAG: XRE family transcriptional regulator [Clostridiales bacterium]|nr:XRE family transcriptional regulator [Clostridiales bacterium]MCD8157477.1 XRE family transcriptional regulator [Clostridiales bacterium]